MTPIIQTDNTFPKNTLLDISTEPTDVGDKCVNTLELVPSTDALIEVPIKKTVRKPKVYETTTEISITPSEDPYEMILFKGKPDTRPENSEPLNETVQTRNEKADVNEPYNFKLYFEKPVTQTETTTTQINDAVVTSIGLNNDLEAFDDGDYEPIDTSMLTQFDADTEKQYNFFEKYPDVWWEGTYRNLSVVPEEDEENVSLLESLSSCKTSFSVPRLSIDKNHSGDELHTQEFFNSGSSNLKSDSLSLSYSSSEEDTAPIRTENKIPRAEVKLLVKSDTDDKSIEVRSVREFVKDNLVKANGKAKVNDRKKRSHTLPNKFSESICTISSKLNNLLEKKKSCSYSFLSKPLETEEIESKNRPTFTLQRLFVRTKDTLNDNPSKELIATSKERFPLNYDFSDDKDKPKIDLYANLPFYPCYDQYALSKSAHVGSIPTHTDPKPHGAYCDWLLQKEANRKGKVDQMQNELYHRF